MFRLIFQKEDQISFSGCLYFVRYWAVSVLCLFVNQVVMFLRELYSNVVNVHNVLLLNEKLFQFRKYSFPLCTFCKRPNENTINLFSQCDRLNFLRTEIIHIMFPNVATNPFNFTDCLYELFNGTLIQI